MMLSVCDVTPSNYLPKVRDVRHENAVFFVGVVHAVIIPAATDVSTKHCYFM